MKTLKEDENEFEDRIRVYLKIKPSIASDKIFYNISKDKNVLSLLDNVTLDDQKKSTKVEIDKIFSHKDENSYIYEEVILNCVNNSLDGENFTFISYGDSNSEKYQLIIGTSDCYDNINNRGLFPRLLESYINKIDSNDVLSDTISLSLSYIMINNNNLIDLTQLMGREKSLEKITRDDLIKKYSKELKIDENNYNNNINYLRAIKKTPVEKSSDSLFFLLQILNLFYKLEASSNHFLSWSYFIILLYVTDNNGKTVSTLSFIIMPGNEILLHKSTRRKSFLGMVEKKDPIALQLKNNAIEFTHVVEDIIKQLDFKEDKIDNDKLEKNKKPEIKSKLFHIIGNLSFDLNNKDSIYDRRYIIIGSMFGNSGHITFTKDTLYFLTQCKKFSTKTTKVSNKPQNFDNTFFDEKLKAKNDQIYDLESKLKTQETKLNELNAIMDSKDANLRALNENYKEQIKSLKAEFGFQGDINNLLNEKVDSSEYKYALKIRDTTEKIKLKNLKIEELKLQIIEIETVIKQLRTLLDVKENDATMLDIIRSIRESKQKKSKEMGVRNEAVRNIEDLEKKNKMLEKKILGYKNEISLKKRILNGLPEIFKTNMNIKKNMQTLEKKLNENDMTMKWFGNSLNEEKKIIKNDIDREKNIVRDKFRSILKQNKKSIKEISNKYENLTTDFQNEKNCYLNELVLLYKFFINMITSYKKSFLGNCSIFAKKDKFDKILNKEEKKINTMTFPLLFREMGKIGFDHFQLNYKVNGSKKKEIKSKYLKNLTKEDAKIGIDEVIKNNQRNKTNFRKREERDKRIFKIINLMKSEFNNEKINKSIEPLSFELIEEKNKLFTQIEKKTENQLNNMTESELIVFCKNNTEKMDEIEKFIKNNFEDKDNFHNFDPVKEREDEIRKKLKHINNKIQVISKKFNNNNIVFEKGDKIIQRLKKENHLIKKRLKENKDYKKNKSRTINYNLDDASNCYNIDSSYSNYFNTILTTSSRNNRHNLIAPNSSRRLTEENTCHKTIDQRKINLKQNISLYNKNKFSKKRPVSSIKRISPYYMVAENL